MRFSAVVALCFAIGTADAQSTPSDLAAIAKAGAEFSQLYMKGDAAGMAALYTAEGAIFPGVRPIIKGRAAIQSYWTLAPNVKMLDHKTTADSVVIVGNTAYDWGTFTSQSSRDGQVGARGYGKYVIVWQKQPNGRWLMHLDIWNGSPAPQGNP